MILTPKWIKVKAKFKNTSPHTLYFENQANLIDKTGRNISITTTSSNTKKAKYGDIKSGEEIEVEFYFENLLPQKQQFRVTFWPSSYLELAKITTDMGEI
jgi:hypothetical protein